MKYLIAIIFLFISLHGYTQHEPSKFFVRDSTVTQTIGNVKKLQVIKLSKKSKKNSLDTVILIDQYFYKNLKPQKRTYYYLDFSKPHKITHFDTLGRIILGANPIKYGAYTSKFHYTGNSIKPDSIDKYWNDSILVSQYINYFKNERIVRQDYIRKDTVRTFVTLEYDSIKRLIRKIDHNTKYGKGFSFGNGFTKDGKTKKILDPNDTTLYKHKINKDTLITSIYRKGKLRTVEKTLSIKELNIKVTENHRFGYVSEREIKYMWPDSSKYAKERFDEKRKIRSYRYTNINPNKTISRYHDKFYFRNKPERKTVLNVNTLYDSKDNWIKKVYIRNNLISRITIRKIEYFND